MRHLSLPSFAAGAALALVLAAVPATAAYRMAAAPDPHPTTYDGTSPTLTLQPPSFVLGASIDAASDPAVNDCAIWNLQVPLRLTWSGSDATSGVAGYDVWEAGPGVDTADGVVVQADVGSTTYRFNGGNYDSDCGGGAQDEEFWVAARDNRGNGARSAAVSQRVGIFQEDGFDARFGGNLGDVSSPTRSGGWSTSNCTCFNGGHTYYSTATGAALSYTVTVQRPGQTVAVVMEKNTNRGRAAISVDGGTASSVETYAPSATHRVIVWQRSLGVGRHTLRIANAGTAGRSRIDVDSLLLQ